ncbi:MAG TPA: DNA primase [Bacteroidales bacterium]|nr:DNA primase [Bacteroidales bacterium]
MIKPETIGQILDAARVEEVVGEFVSLKKRGVNLIGLCPFHNEKTPSFNVSPARGIYKCFGCGKGGNAVNFLMEHEHYTYPEALKYLANKYSIEVEETKPTPEQLQEQDEKESLYNLTAFAQKFFEETLHQSEEGKAIALTYLKERGFLPEVIKKFGIGYCPDQWDTFTRLAIKNGYKKEYLLKTSLSKEKDYQHFDTFRGRIVFPVHNLSGRVLGFGGRILTSDKNKPKYLNSAESDIYQKSKILYGLFFAKNAIVKADNCYLVEGYTDVISLHQAGIENVIASSGTSLTADQIRLIRRYTSNITLLFDGDPAGIKAAFRGIDMILEEGLNIRLVLFPEGEDPDSYARKYRPVEVKAFVEANTVDFISFKTNILLEETGDDPIRKAVLIKEIAQTISLIPEPIARSLYSKKCSGLLQVDERMLIDEINKQVRQKHNRDSKTNTKEIVTEQVYTATQQAQTSHITNGHHEKEVIRMLLLYAGNMLEFEGLDEFGKPAPVSVRLLNFVVDDFNDDQLNFDNATCQKIYEIFARYQPTDIIPPIQEFTGHPDEDVRNMVINLISTPHALSQNWSVKHRIFVKSEEDHLRDNLLNVVYSFKLKRLERMIAQNQEKIKTSTDVDEQMELLETDRQLKIKVGLFAQALNRIITR